MSAPKRTKLEPQTLVINRPLEFLECGASGGVQTLEILERIQAGKKNTKKTSGIYLPFSKRVSHPGNTALLERHFCLQNTKKNQRRDFDDTSQTKIEFFGELEKTRGTRTGSISGQKGDSRSRGVTKCKNFSTPLEWELDFCEKVAQTRAGDGVAHRILENVTFERRGDRVTPSRDKLLRAAFPRAPGQR